MKMFDIAIVTSTMQHPNKGTVVELGIKKKFKRSFFFGRDIYDITLARALSLLAAFLQRPLFIKGEFVINFNA